MYRQGDVWIGSPVKMPKNVVPVARENGLLVLAHGEVTGHMHAVAEVDAEMFREENGTLYLRAPSGATVTHQEHSASTLPKTEGQWVYPVIRQREYAGGIVQRVQD